MTLGQQLTDSGTVSRKGWTPFCRDLVNKTLEQAEDLDSAIAEVLENWRVARLSQVDRIILRMGLCEMRSFPDIPIRVTLNEYIELAKQFGTAESAAFVNGVLDKLARSFANKDFVDRSRKEASRSKQDE